MTAPNTTQGSVTLIYDTTQGDVTVTGQLDGTVGRSVTFSAAPKPGYAFSFWELELPGETLTFGVFSGLGTINGKALPFTTTVPLGTVVPVSCVAADNYKFDRAETFNIEGQSLGLYLSPDFSIVANGEVDDVRAYFTPIGGTDGGGTPIGCLPDGAFCAVNGDCCSGFCSGEPGMAGTCFPSSGTGGGTGPTQPKEPLF